MTNIRIDSTDNESLRRTRLYAGDIYIYSATLHSQMLYELANELAKQAFAPFEPQTAHRHISVTEYIRILTELKPKFIHHPHCKRIIPLLLADLGCNLSNTYFDVPRLRSACPSSYLTTGIAYAFKPHRDTWYSPPMSQINWWLPVYPITPENTLAFHPNYWDQPVSNNSALFNYQNWTTGGRVAATQQPIDKDTRFQSAAIEPIELLPDLRVTCPPGGIIVFSAAHLHSTVPNSTDETRFSIDFRTVDRTDVICGNGARNIDSESTGTTLADYLSSKDLSQLPDELVQQYMNKRPNPLYATPVTLVEKSLA